MKCFSLVLFCLVVTFGAQAETISPPITPELKRLLVEGVTAGASVDPSSSREASVNTTAWPTSFTFSGSTPVFVQIANSLTANEPQRRAVLQLLQQGRQAFEQEASKEGFGNDLSAALALFLTQQWSIARGGAAIDETGSTRFAKKLRSALASPAMKTTKDAEKQALYEWLLGSSFLSAASWELGKSGGNEASLLQLRKAAGVSLQSLLGMNADGIEFGPEGLMLSPRALAADQAKSTPGASTDSPRESAGGTREVAPGSVAKGRPNGLFWRFRVSLSQTMSVETFVFLPDGRLTTSPQVDQNGSLDWPRISSEGHAGSWSLEGDQLTITRSSTIPSRTAPLSVEYAAGHQLRLKWLGETWKPAAANPTRLVGRYHSESSSSSDVDGYDSSSSGDYLFTEDGRYAASSTRAVLADASGRGAAAGSTSDEGRYSLRGNALLLQGRSGPRIRFLVQLSDEALLIDRTVYLLTP